MTQENDIRFINHNPYILNDKTMSDEEHVKTKRIIEDAIAQLEKAVGMDYRHEHLINALWGDHVYSLDKIAKAVVEVVQMRSNDDRLATTKNLMRDFNG